MTTVTHFAMTFGIIDPLASRTDPSRPQILPGAKMRRREFVQAAATAYAGSALAGCAPGLLGVGMSQSRADARGALDASAFRAERRYLDSPYGGIAYVERGSGPAALFLHGFPLNSFQWRGALERLSPLRRCIAPDFLALATQVTEGQSVAPEAQAAMIIALLDRLGIASADLVANDSGGAVAQALVHTIPLVCEPLLLTNATLNRQSARTPACHRAGEGRQVR
jgi:hypothetical protein